MLNRECIHKIIKDYLPTADEKLIAYLSTQAERQIELVGRDIIRKLVLGKEQGMLIGTTKIDTKI